MPTSVKNDPRYYDFDAAFAEEEAKPIPFKVLGQVWELPPVAPAAIVLKVQRLFSLLATVAAGQDLPEDTVIDDDLSYDAICRQLIGDDIVDQWLEQRISYPMLQGVTRRLWAIYSGEGPEPEEPAEDEAKRPGKAPQDRRPAAKKAASSRSPQRRSSSTGR